MKDPKKIAASRPPVSSLQAPALDSMEPVYQVWDELDKIHASNAEGALRELALQLKKLLKADNIKWRAAIRVLQGSEAQEDLLFGWRLRANYDLVPNSKEYQKVIAWLYHRNNRPKPGIQIGLATQALAAGAGTFRVHRMRDGWIPFHKFYRSKHYQLHYTQQGITDRMWISFPLNADTESIFLIDHVHSTRRFSAQDALLAGTILRGIRGFHRRLFLGRGLLIGEKPLSPVLHRIILQLLSGTSEKDIARSMNQKLATTHKYIGTIYDRFGVKGRAALMSLWLVS